jgi:hypothetical protein
MMMTKEAESDPGGRPALLVIPGDFKFLLC